MPEKPLPAGQAARLEALTQRSEQRTLTSADASEGRQAGQARGRLLRFPLRRRATEAKKPPCPFCGGETSSVYRSKGVLTKAGYRRRRQCAECGEDWPTIEGIDVELFARQLEKRGLTLADVGLEADKAAEGQGRSDHEHRRLK